MRKLALFVCAGIVVALTTACTPSVPPPPPLAKVSGTVSLDGQPMKAGEISFEASAQPLKTFEIKDGVFSGEVFSGKNKVRFHVWKAGPPASTDPEKKPTRIESLPPKYNAESTFSADVPAGGASDLKFEATSK